MFADEERPPRHRVLVNVAERDWAVHFIGPDGRTRIGPWLLLENDAAVVKILRWCGASDEDVEDYHCDMHRWGHSSVDINLSDSKLAALVARGRGWPWNGYELLQMKEAGRYPPKPNRRPGWEA
jgi:hypothetical protein